MHVVKHLWIGIWKIALALGFLSLGLFGLGLMVGAAWYPTGIFWGIIIFLMGLLGVCLSLGGGMTLRNPDNQQPL